MYLLSLGRDEAHICEDLKFQISQILRPPVASSSEWHLDLYLSLVIIWTQTQLKLCQRKVIILSYQVPPHVHIEVAFTKITAELFLFIFSHSSTTFPKTYHWQKPPLQSRLQPTTIKGKLGQQTSVIHCTVIFEAAHFTAHCSSVHAVIFSVPTKTKTNTDSFSTKALHPQ